jgi:nucleoside-diphosphate-sugar epimerase
MLPYSSPTVSPRSTAPAFLSCLTHVDNVVEGLRLGAHTGRGGEASFVTDGELVMFREFVSALLETQVVTAPSRSIPNWVAGPWRQRVRDSGGSRRCPGSRR